MCQIFLSILQKSVRRKNALSRPLFLVTLKGKWLQCYNNVMFYSKLVLKSLLFLLSDVTAFLREDT